MTKFLVMMVLSLTGVAAKAQSMDRATCYAMASGYTYVYNAVKAGRPRAEVEARVIEMGAAAGASREKLVPQVTQAIGAIYANPALLTLSPDQVAQIANSYCPQQPHTITKR